MAVAVWRRRCAPARVRPSDEGSRAVGFASDVPDTVPMVRRSLIVIVAVLALVVAGCGGSEDPESAATLDQIETFANQQLASRLDANQSADPFTCEEDGDSQWECETEVRTSNPEDADADEEVESLTVNVTCDAAASCVYLPET